ncbi:peptidoglycan-binding domain-containing protein [Yinghuangia soli]|uniref:Peptidoglycan-binding protein n=1 Tax=Yinghuangia soli TaxID=2908204 RepID=A0AA41Q7T8_9ACTN|nr:peptidoglycan-binding domain-containing protein [Yinghuangia soli]MCF2532796.1 peptidoglycan-binding protein [Yinghuangia soli]
MRTVSRVADAPRTPRSARRTRTAGRNRAAVLLLSGAVAAAAGVVAPSAVAAPRCNYVSQDNRPELGESSEGDAVAQAQCLINTRSGYPTKFDVSGIFGPETTKAVLWVQQCNKVKESGYTDEATWKVLYRAKKGCGKPRSPAKPKPTTPTAKPTKPNKPAKPTKPAKPKPKPTKPAKPASEVLVAPLDPGVPPV